MRRAAFLAGIGALPLLGAGAGGDIIDPAQNSPEQALRVLLGRGQAVSAGNGEFLFNGRRYRGTFAFTPQGEIVNTLPLEQYLYSVVSREMPHSWPAAALQTQAVVARTYVLQRSRPERDYDLVPSEADQVYTGIDAEHPESTSAVDATSRQVLRFGEGFAQIAYSSCCGGHTESNAAAWGGTPLTYLGGVRCPYCSDSPWYTWQQTLPMQRVQSALGSRLAGIGALHSIQLDTPDPSGRAQYWIFTGSSGTQRVKAADVRFAIGTRTLPSLLVRKLDGDLGGPALDGTDAPGMVSIQGGGLGHGVGLCQWGARGMALTGAPARAILSFYFPGTAISDD